MAINRLRDFVQRCSLVAAGCLLAGGVGAQNVTDFFQLDGNVAQNGNPLKLGGKDDWATVNALVPINSSAKARTGVQPDPAPASIFTTGGSKDDLDVSSWRFKNGAVPDKDDITNAYAAAYNINGKLYIYAGADRFDNSGDAFMGFWFFQNQVVGPTSTSTSGAFSGTHTIGDILVLANFTGGGTTVNIEVLKWVGSGGNVNGTLQRIAGIAGGTPALCGAAGTDPRYCGITNAGQVAETPPWPYQAKDGSTKFIPAGFLELGINISEVLGSTPCFASFMAETRSSSSVSATLKDFALHDLPVCGIQVSKSCAADKFNIATQDFSYKIAGQILNTGFGSLNNVVLTDDPVIPAASFGYYKCDANKLPDLSQLVNFTGTLAGGTDVCYQAPFTSPTNQPSDAITATAKAGTAAVPPSTASATCPKIEVPSVITVTKECATSLEYDQTKLFVAVNITGEVCNMGSSNLTSVSATDPFIGSGTTLTNLLGDTPLLTPGNCKSYTSKYYPNATNPAQNRLAPSSSTTVPGAAMFKDTVTASALSAFGTVKPATALATCYLCPNCQPTDACSKDTAGVTSCMWVKP